MPPADPLIDTIRAGAGAALTCGLVAHGLEFVQAAAVGDRPRFWAASITEAETLVSAAGSLVTVDDLHRLPSEHGEPWAIIEAKEGA